MCSMLLVSCVFDTEPQCMLIEGDRTVSFTISLNEAATRVDCNQTDDKVPFDHYIQLGTLRVMMTQMDNTVIGEIERMSVWPTNAEQTEFMFTGKLPEGFVFDAENPKYKFFALVNAPQRALDEELTLYNIQQLDPRNENSAIPMWGVMSVDLTPILNVSNYEIPEPIWLLRSAAKIEVQLSDELKAKGKTSIESAVLKYYNVEGYVAPANWHSYENTQQLNCELAIHNYRHAAIKLPMIKDEDTGNYYIYMPEYDNLNYPEERNKISLTFIDDGKEKVFEDAISFCEYKNGKLIENSDYNIVRNHIYRFTIRSISGERLQLDYTVADWETEDWDGNGKEYEEHDLSYPTYHNPVVPYEFLGFTASQQEEYVIKQVPQMYFGGINNLEAGAFHCYFQITAPELVEWKPVFMGSKENYRIRVYGKTAESANGLLFDTAVEGKQENLGACSAGEWYHIVVFPLSDDGADKTEIEFGISYFQRWTDQYINLYVNGEYGNIRWPNSGDNPKIIKIKHTSALAQS